MEIVTILVVVFLILGIIYFLRRIEGPQTAPHSPPPGGGVAQAERQLELARRSLSGPFLVPARA
ncbi:MAG: hypothetical protein ACR2H7_01730 [Actinomycetota bacterium]